MTKSQNTIYNATIRNPKPLKEEPVSDVARGILEELFLELRQDYPPGWSCESDPPNSSFIFWKGPKSDPTNAWANGDKTVKLVSHSGRILVGLSTTPVQFTVWATITAKSDFSSNINPVHLLDSTSWIIDPTNPDALKVLRQRFDEAIDWVNNKLNGFEGHANCK